MSHTTLRVVPTFADPAGTRVFACAEDGSEVEVTALVSEVVWKHEANKPAECAVVLHAFGADFRLAPLAEEARA